MANLGDANEETTQLIIPLTELCSTVSGVVKELMAEIRASSSKEKDSPPPLKWYIGVTSKIYSLS